MDVVEHLHLIIGGRPAVPAGAEVIDVTSPHTEQVVARVPHASVVDADRAVAVARDAFEHGRWPRLPLDQRIGVIRRIGESLAARKREVAALVSLQNGAPMGSAVPIQVLTAAAIYQAACTVAEGFTFEERRAGIGGPVLVRHEPVGVVVAIAPWNTPQASFAAKLAPALLAGCTVILKPSPETVLDAYVLAEICAEAGLPEGVLSVLPAGREVGAYLVGHHGVDCVSFTGSVAGGRLVMAGAAQNLSRVTLELGGKSAAIVLEDADFSVVLPQLIGAAFVNSGQACAALTRVLLPARRYDRWAEHLTEAVAALAVGDPSDPHNVVGPLVTSHQRDRVLDSIRLGQDEGAKLLTGGGIPAHLDTGWYVEPTLLGDVDNTMRVAREEIFGPVVCLIRYETEEEAIAIANDSDFGLSGAVWSADLERGVDIARRIRTGTVSVNCYRLDLGAPFGGFKQSGLGRELDREGLEAYLETKTVNLPNH